MQINLDMLPEDLEIAVDELGDLIDEQNYGEGVTHQLEALYHSLRKETEE